MVTTVYKTFQNVIDLGNQDDDITIAAGANIVSLNSGNNTVKITGGGVTALVAFDGNDRAIVTTKSYVPTIDLSAGNNFFKTGAGNIGMLNAYDGNDIFELGSGYTEFVKMGRGNNTITTSTGGVGSIVGYGGDDTVNLGSGGASTIDLFSGNDYVTVSKLVPKDNFVFVNAGYGEDAKGNAFVDTIDFSKFTKSLDISLGGITEVDTGDGYFGLKAFENAVGGKGSDRLHGNNAANVLTGGAGKDTFVFSDTLNAKTNVDTLADFNVKDDAIALADYIFTKAGEIGHLSSKAFWASDAGTAHDKDDRIVYAKSDGHLYYDADGTGKGKAVQFADLASGLKMTAGDFVIV